MRWVGFFVASLVVVGCSSSTPATTPTSIPTTATTTTLATTTTVDRVAEIEAIYQNLDRKRFGALYEADTEAFGALFANQAYLEVSLAAFDLLDFDGPPTVEVVVIDVVADYERCLAAWVQGTVDGIKGNQILMVLQPLSTGSWGYSFGGEGWLCDGPHPLES